MAFGQQSGPPASHKQVEQLTELLRDAGYDSLREARHPFGLTQRQAGGKFTRDEADELIGKLQSAEDALDETQTEFVKTERVARAKSDKVSEALASIPDEALADELTRRGWVCIPSD
jgi:hypothetical protein